MYKCRLGRQLGDLSIQINVSGLYGDTYSVAITPVQFVNKLNDKMSKLDRKSITANSNFVKKKLPKPYLENTRRN